MGLFVLPQSLQIDFWTQFMQAFEEELVDFKDEQIDIFQLLYDVRNQTDEVQLLEIAKQFGYEPDRSLNDSLAFLQSEVLSVIFRIQNKSTLFLYNFIYKLTGYDGYVFSLYYNGSKLVKAVDKPSIDTNLNTYLYPSIFKGFTPEQNFSDIIDIDLFYDNAGADIKYDDPDIEFFYDTKVEKTPTKHLVFEYIPDTLITKDTTEYIMTSEYINYLENATEPNRKSTEIPHVGFNIAFMVDESGFFDTNNTIKNTYSLPDIKVRCFMTPFYSTIPPAYVSGFEYGGAAGTDYTGTNIHQGGESDTDYTGAILQVAGDADVGPNP